MPMLPRPTLDGRYLLSERVIGIENRLKTHTLTPIASLAHSTPCLAHSESPEGDSLMGRQLASEPRPTALPN